MEETKQIKVSVFTPLIYLAIILTCFIGFSIFYRRRQVKNLQEAEPIFEENYTALLYNTLKLQYNDATLSKEQKPHDRVMKAALLRRGTEGIRRSLKLKENEAVYKNLYENGLIGDEIYQQYTIQVKFQELEVKEIANECELYKKGWSQQFFKVAQEICFNEALRRRLSVMDQRAKDLADLWEYQVHKSEVEPIKTTVGTTSVEAK